MNAATTHISIAAFHEAGHALAALSEGRQVFGLGVSTENPGDGICVSAVKQSNPYDLSENSGSAKAAWLHTMQTTSSDIRIFLAGPLAEAKALGKPLRSLGSRSDLEKCIRLANRLECLNTFVSEFVDIDELKGDDVLDSERKRVRRWISLPRVWNAISLAAERLSSTGKLNRQDLDNLVGRAFVNEWQFCFEFDRVA
jgi:hypothetical protein